MRVLVPNEPAANKTGVARLFAFVHHRPGLRNQPLPGAVNVAFFDGHGETVKLDNLWQLYWHADYKPPVSRIGVLSQASVGAWGLRNCYCSGSANSFIMEN